MIHQKPYSVIFFRRQAFFADKTEIIARITLFAGAGGRYHQIGHGLAHGVDAGNGADIVAAFDGKGVRGAAILVSLVQGSTIL